MATSGDPLMGAYLQHLVRAWLAEDQARSEAELARLSGLTRAGINVLKNRGAGAGPQTVAKIAVAFGKTPSQLYEDGARWAREGRLAVAAPAVVPLVRLGDLRGWTEAEQDARRLCPRIPEEAFRRAADLRCSDAPIVDAQTVAAFARAWWEAEGRRE